MEIEYLPAGGIPHAIVSVVFLSGEKEGRTLFCSFLLKERGYFGLPFADDHRNPRFDDPCLFRGYFCKGVPQQRHVVEADVGDDADFRGDNICGVEPSSQTGFDDGDVDFFACEIVKGQGCRELEKGGGDLFVVVPPVKITDHAYNLCLGDHPSVDSDPLPEIDQVWRGVESGAVP